MRQLKISKQITKRDSDSLEKYLQEIGKVEMVTPEEEVILAQKIRQGDQAALERLVSANLRFVVSVAKQYQNKSLSLNDLINEGNLGLVKAAQRFDESKGFKFISYAVWWIRQSIIKALAEQSRLVRLPSNKLGSLMKINKAFSDLEQQYEREPSPEELAAFLDVKPEEIENTLGISGTHVSFDAPFQEGESNSLLDVIQDGNAEMADRRMDYQDSLKRETEISLASLSKTQRDVIRLHYGLSGNEAMSLDDIGESLNLSKERVRQIRDQAITKLRSSTRSKSLKSFLGE
ncbi:MAG: RNA polymerase sigma factor RpoD/SigA [Bacteroidota bacterium]|jgi:RNA polymerase primary sigma factor|nr:sigma-70 family RNA polymerase sigma factor [Bacteroidota bacterium]GDX48592.1 RNA polymerase sigma factor RpoD [Bacteroidota bacterium]